MSASLYRLLSWLSPSYPIGAYTYSQGVEFAVEAGLISDKVSCCEWLSDILRYGTGHSDAVLLAATYSAADDPAAMRHLAETASVFVPTKEIALENQAQGAAFTEITAKTWPCTALDELRQCWDGPLAYPVVVGAVAAGHGIPRDAVITGYLHALAANLVSAAVRLVPLGQTDGQAILAALEADVATVAESANNSKLEDLSSATLMVDWTSMQHETQYTRLFRS